MDTILSAHRITSIVLIIIVVVHSVHSIENIEQNMPESDSVTNSTQNSRENIRDISSPKVLSRRKRFVAFPEGSSFSVGKFSKILYLCITYS